LKDFHFRVFTSSHCSKNPASPTVTLNLLYDLESKRGLRSLPKFV